MNKETVFLLRCELGTLRQSTRGSITGNLEARIGPFVFPGPGWSDFVAIVLGWWLEALHTLESGQQSVELRFMDGPYLMRIGKESPLLYVLTCVEDRPGRTVVCQCRVDPAQVLSEIVRTASDVLAACAAKNWAAPALRSLESRLGGPRH
jgi:hypothetical protein